MPTLHRPLYWTMLCLCLALQGCSLSLTPAPLCMKRRVSAEEKNTLLIAEGKHTAEAPADGEEEAADRPRGEEEEEVKEAEAPSHPSKRRRRAPPVAPARRRRRPDPSGAAPPAPAPSAQRLNLACLGFFLLSMPDQSEEAKLQALCDGVKDQNNLDRIRMVDLLEAVLAQNPQLASDQALHSCLDDQALYNSLFLATSEKKRGHTQAVREAAQSLLNKLVAASALAREKVRQAFLTALRDNASKPTVRRAALGVLRELVKKNAELVNSTLIDAVLPITEDTRLRHAAARNAARETLQALVTANPALRTDAVTRALPFG